MILSIPSKYTMLCFVALSFFILPFLCNAEKIYLKDNTTITGSIIAVIDDSIWILPIPKEPPIEIKIAHIERVENDGGSFSEDALETLSETSKKYIKQGRYSEAIKLYNILLKAFPDNMKIYYLRGLLNHEIGKLKEAALDYQRIIEKGMADAEIFNNLGAIYAQNEDYTKAEHYFTEALKNNPNITEVHLNLAHLLMQTKEFIQAIEEYKKALKHQPDNIEALCNLGVAYSNEQKYAEAKEQWEKVLALNPKDSEAKKNLELLENENRNSEESTISPGDNETKENLEPLEDKNNNSEKIEKENADF